MFFHGSWLRSQSFSSPGYMHVQIPERLVYPGSVSLSGSPGFGDGRPSLSGSWCRHHLGKVQFPSVAASGLSGCYSGFHSLQGFSLPAESEKLCLITEAFLFCFIQPVSLWRQASLWPKSTLTSTSGQMLRVWGWMLTSWTQPLLAFGLRREHYFPQCKGASCGGVRSTALPSSGSQLHCSGLFRQLDLLGLSLQTGEHSISSPQFH